MGDLLMTIVLFALAMLAALASLKRLRRGSACCGEHEAAPRRTGPADRNRAHYPHAATLRIGGMTCENCARRVENALNALEGTWARVSIETHTAEVLTKQPPDEAALREAVQRAGYVVSDFTPR